MINRTGARRLRRQQLNRQLASIANLTTPRNGWIRELREALGMSARQLAERVGVGQPTIARLEKSEAAGTIEIKTLRRVAEGMNCRLVYAIVPVEGSLEELLRVQATQAAEKLLARVEHSMALEAQGATPQDRKAQVQELADELVRTMSRQIWEQDDYEQGGHSH
ncbi:mobile mystery protein A [Armatimonas sp.]|uniref:mobile mystery protein A n=1 Tax=Armatimonas sp. TaxID=1872638 RepID=UPI00375020B7